MNEVYNYLEPVNPWYGFVDLDDFNVYVADYAWDKGHGYLYSKKLKAIGKTRLETINFIKAGITRDTPVATLNLAIPGTYKYGWHWMTITGVRGLPDDTYQLIVSTWGDDCIISYYTHWLNAQYSGGGYIYFY